MAAQVRDLRKLEVNVASFIRYSLDVLRDNGDVEIRNAGGDLYDRCTIIRN